MPFVILPTNSASGGYDITNSLRFNGGSSDYLNRTLGTSTSRRIYTMSAWIKRSKLDVYGHIFTFGPNPGSWDSLRFDNDNKLAMRINDDTYVLQTSQVFRDVSAWYHIVVAIDTTQATASNRVRMYVNGSEVTAFTTSSYPAQNYDTAFTSGNVFRIGLPTWNTSQNIDSYLSEAFFIDGQQLTPSSFGETDTDTGIWKPKAYTGTYGTNGFYLQFKNSASLGTDSSGNGNTFTVNNLTSIDQTTDTPTNNFCTLNPLKYNSHPLSDGNTTVNPTSAWKSTPATFAVDKGKWYWEYKTVGNYNYGGVASIDFVNAGMSNEGGEAPIASSTVQNYCLRNDDGNIYYNNSGTAQINGGNLTSAWTSATIGVALDCDNSKLYWYKNGTIINSGGYTIASGLGYIPFGSFYGNIVNYNFGNPPYSANSYTDGAGYGNFSYAVPSGYYSLNTRNLANFG
jgi:hypothetical protein